ncbi:hypothetical protein [Solihabitans fulvus]|uniref:hypothetical protein n=1 Tax=Solihabitans fulvus TaxID=1892852 RepID=UPI0016620597|nr:hypothetical protein [Solihabitans fulvus]
MAGNPLVVSAARDSGDALGQGTGQEGWATGVAVASDAVDAFNGIKDGNWVDAGLGIASFAMDAVALAVDPFGVLMQSAAAFLMEHLQPLKQALDWLAGNPPVIQSYGATWGSVSKELKQVATDYAAAVQQETADWQGQAADAYRAAAKAQTEALNGAGDLAEGVSTAVTIMGAVVDFVRQFVRDTIAELIGKLISWVLEEVFSLGFGTPLVVAQAMGAIAQYGTKIANKLKSLIETLKKASPLLKKLIEVFEKVIALLKKFKKAVHSKVDGASRKAKGAIDHVTGGKLKLAEKHGMGGHEQQIGFVKRTNKDGEHPAGHGGGAGDSPGHAGGPEHSPGGSTPGDHPAGSTPGDHPAGSTQGDHPAGAAPGDHPAGSTPGDHPAGSAPGERPTGSTPGDHPAGSTQSDHPAGSVPGEHPGGGSAPGEHPSSADHPSGTSSPSDRPSGGSSPTENRATGPTSEHPTDSSPTEHPAGSTPTEHPAGSTPTEHPTGSTPTDRPSDGGSSPTDRSGGGDPSPAAHPSGGSAPSDRPSGGNAPESAPHPNGAPADRVAAQPTHEGGSAAPSQHDPAPVGGPSTGRAANEPTASTRMTGSLDDGPHDRSYGGAPAERSQGGGPGGEVSQPRDTQVASAGVATEPQPTHSQPAAEPHRDPSTSPGASPGGQPPMGGGGMPGGAQRGGGAPSGGGAGGRPGGEGWTGRPGTPGASVPPPHERPGPTGRPGERPTGAQSRPTMPAPRGERPGGPPHRPNEPRPNASRPGEPHPNTPRQDQPHPNGAHPNEPRPNAARPGEPHSTAPRPGQPHPNNAHPNEARPNTPRPGEPRPNTPRPNETRPNTPRHSEPHPNEPRPSQPHPNAAHPNEARPNPARPNEPRPNTPRPGEPRPNTPHPNEPRPNGTHPDQPRPTGSHPNEPRPNTPRPNESRPNTPRPDQPHPSATHPNDPRPNTPRHGEPHSSEPRPNQPHPNAARPNETRPNTPHSGEPHPNGAHPNETRPNAAHPNEPRPNGTHPAETHPSTRRPGESHPGNEHPVDAGARGPGEEPRRLGQQDHPGSEPHRTNENQPRQHHDDPNHQHDPGAAGKGEQPSNVEYAQANSTRTQAGESLHGNDAEMQHLAGLVPPDPHAHTIDGHGGPHGMVVGDRTYDAHEFAEYMRNNPNWDGKTPIRLIGCDTGKLPDGFAHDLSKELGVPVIAPTKPVWSDTQGRVFSTGYTKGPNGELHPKWPPDGEWKTFHPDGSSHTVGHDGFPPGHEHHDLNEHPVDARARAAEPEHPHEDDPEYDPVPKAHEVLPRESEFVPWDRPHDKTFDHPPDSPMDIKAPTPDRDRSPVGAPVEHPSEVPTVLAEQELKAHYRYDVTYENGLKTSFFTDEHGKVKWVEAEGGLKKAPDGTVIGFNPDIGYPLLPDVKYRVNDNWTFHTDEHGQTDSMTGKPSYQKSDGNYRDDSGDYSAQGRAGGEGRAAYAGTEYEDTKWAGGHLGPNEGDAPGEYVNMFPQMNASNSGHDKDGWINAASWRRQEEELASYGKTPGCSIDQLEVRMTRREDGVPAEVTMRWTQTGPGPDGVPVTKTMERVFPNRPEDVNYGPKVKYKRKRT